ncbi:hypothetical protein K3495_g572 [Podosphaera aphanis]|nr:hypothetical protein K3495_g572 [Podosphaera aphanis]
MPAVADPRPDDRTVNIAKESDDKCYKFHRSGYWVINCPQKSESYTPILQNVKNSTILLKGQSNEKIQAFQDTELKFKNN